MTVAPKFSLALNRLTIGAGIGVGEIKASARITLAADSALTITKNLSADPAISMVVDSDPTIIKNLSADPSMSLTVGSDATITKNLSADPAITVAVDSEPTITKNLSADPAMSLTVDSEIKRAIQADPSLTLAVSADINRAIQGGPAISLAVDSTVTVGGDFSPPDIANLVGWWDASALTGFSDNDPVGGSGSEFADQSGNGYDFKQSTGTLQPLYKTGILNGKPGLLYDGAGDRLVLDSDVTVSQGYTIFALIKLTDNAVNHKIISNLTGGESPVEAFQTGGSQYMFFNNGTNLNPGSGTWDTDACLFRFEGNGTSSKIVSRLDSTTGDSGTNDLTLGQIGNQYSSFIKGYIFELIVYSSILSAGDIANLAGYFEDKWGSGI